MNPKILYESEYILGLDKPSGLLVHSDGRSEEKTLVDWVNHNYPSLKEVGEEQILQTGERIKRPGIVHRLDRDTSGVIIVAKTQETHQFLKEQFQNRKIEKVYNAVVWGKFKNDIENDSQEGNEWQIIDKPIGRSASDFRKWSAEFGAKGELREAITEYRVLAQSNNPLNPSYLKRETKQKNTNNNFSYLEVRPKTGRTHQIRVHLKSISHPVICDKLYSPNKVCDSSGCLGFNRLALHALSIKVGLLDGTFVNIESPLPVEFQKTLSLLKKG